MIKGKTHRRVGLVLALLCLLAGCGGQEDAYALYLEDLKPALRYWDTLSQTYLEALEGVGDYLADPTPERLEAARTGCAGAAEAISALEVPGSALTAEEEAAMGELDLDPTDYDAFFETLQYEKDTRLQALDDTLVRLEAAPVLDDVQAVFWELYTGFEQGERQLLQIGVNHLLCGVPPEVLDPFRTNFLNGLVLWDEAAIPWSEDRAALDALGEEVLTGMEELSGRQAQKLGEIYAQALE